MHSLQFWKSWPAVYRRLLGVLSLLLIASLVLTLYSFLEAPAPVFTWQQLQELHTQELPIYTFDVAGFKLTVSADNYILFERWLGNPLQPNLRALDIYLFFYATAFVLLLAIVTVLPRFWFLAASGVLVFIISSYGLDKLLMPELQNKIPTVVCMVVFVGIGIYFQYINSLATLLQRILAYLLAVVILGLAISNLSGLAHPLRYFAANTLPSAIVMLAVFMILVAHEILASFVSLVGRGTRSSKSLRHYFLISAFYLINLWLVYWSKIGWIDWDFTIQPILLLCISGILAIWGIRQRQPQYERVLPADPFAVYFMISLGILALGTTGYFLASANDIALLSLNDLILYTHIGYGMMFVVYLASNFLGLLAQNLPVYKVLYKPANMPYISYRIAGLVFTLAFVFYNTWMVPVNHFVSGYYTSLGDVFYENENAALSFGYYKQAHAYAPYNQHAATALAQLETFRGNGAKELIYLKDANQYKPTEFTLLSEADAYHRSRNTFEELLTLQEARDKLPASGAIRNNLGLTYSRLGLIDSAYRYFTSPQNNKLTGATAEMNLLGLIAENNLQVNPDSVNQLPYTQQLRVMSNALAIANRRGKIIDTPVELPRDSLFDLFSSSMVGNYITNHQTRLDTSFLNSCITMARLPQNEIFKETLLVPVARACYAAGLVNRAYQLLQGVIVGGNHAAMHNTTLALWSLEQHKPKVAIPYLQYALDQKSAQAAFVYAVALAETGRTNDAIVAWDQQSQGGDSTMASVAESMKRLLAAPYSWYKGLSDTEKYRYIRYRVPLHDSIQFELCLRQISNEDLKAKTILDRSRKWFEIDEADRASFTFQKLQGIHLTDMQLFADIKYFELRLFAARKQWPLLQEHIGAGILFGPYRETERRYYEALKQIQAGDSISAAKSLYWVASNNFYFDEGVAAAATFFQDHDPDNRRAYFILSEALQVNPHSVRILKAYIPIAFARGFDQYANSAYQTLLSLITPQAALKYVKENHLSPLLLQ